MLETIGLSAPLAFIGVMICCGIYCYVTRHRSKDPNDMGSVG